MEKKQKRILKKLGWSEKCFEEKLENKGTVWKEIEEIMRHTKRKNMLMLWGRGGNSGAHI